MKKPNGNLQSYNQTNIDVGRETPIMAGKGSSKEHFLDSMTYYTKIPGVGMR